MDGATYLAQARTFFEAVRRRADQALAQVDDARFATRIDPESNSLALIVKHLAGNLRSRWTDFLTTDGEKPDRRRDGEFEVEAGDAREALMRRWEEGWAVLLAALDALTRADLDRDVHIRGEPLSVFDAIERQKEHYAYHVGQIVFLAKHLAGPAWTSLSIPRGQSEHFHAARRAAGVRRGFR